ncbi:MAG: NAD(P)-dependent oxidoreductase [Planctomycetota bacterium]
MTQPDASQAEKNTAKAAKPLRVAVTGGSGRIGRHVVKCLMARGHAVLNLDRMQPPEPVAKLHYVDLTRRELVQPLFEQVDAVCHLGEIPGIHGAWGPEQVYAHNTQAGSVVLQTAADLKLPRVIYTSTCQVYGCFGDPPVPPVCLPFDETHPLRPQNAYALSKVANEGYAQFLARHQKMSIALFRLPAVWDFKEDEALPENIRHWLQHSPKEVLDLAAYLHSEDAALAFALAVERPHPGCEAYHFSAKEVCSGAPLRERLEKYNPDYPQIGADWPAYASPLLCAKAKAHFGWEPAHNLLDVYRRKFGKEPHE